MDVPLDVLIQTRAAVTLEDLVRVFEQTERAIVAEIITRLELRPEGEVEYTREWASGKLARARKVRERLQELADNPVLAERIMAAETLVKSAWLSGVEDAAGHPVLSARILPTINTIPQGVRALAHEQTVLLSRVRSNYWRAGNRAYRQAVAEVSSLVVSGSMGSREASKRVAERLEERGVGAFKDKAGRSWGSRNYVDMCVRTTTHRANITGKTGTFLALGERFVRVSEHEKECRLCRPWENRILILEGEAEPPAVATLAHAQAVGLFHPRCSHTVDLYIP